MEIKLAKTPTDQFDQWLELQAREYGYTVSVHRQKFLARYSVKRDDQDIAEIETMPVGENLRLTVKRQSIEKHREHPQMTVPGFIEILDRDLQKDYNAKLTDPLEGMRSWILYSFVDARFDDPEQETKRQALATELTSGLPKIVLSEPTNEGKQAQEATPTNATPGKRIDLQLKKAGRPEDPLYAKARQKIGSGESEIDVYKWYLMESGITNPDRGTRDAFKKAIGRQNR